LQKIIWPTSNNVKHYSNTVEFVKVFNNISMCPLLVNMVYLTTDRITQACMTSQRYTILYGSRHTKAMFCSIWLDNAWAQSRIARTLVVNIMKSLIWSIKNTCEHALRKQYLLIFQTHISVLCITTKLNRYITPKRFRTNDTGTRHFCCFR